MEHYAIAIDGPAGAGKTTVVKLVAEKLNLKCVDTGAMYRTIALKVLQNGKSTKVREDVLEALNDIDIKVEYNENGQVMYLDGVNVNGLIRTPECSQGASDVGVFPEVRIKLVELQREIAKHESVIMDGRDIGSYVLPDAKVKVYMTASVEERARRRMLELEAKGHKTDFEELKKSIEERDYQDSHREFAPLCVAKDAVVIDTTDMTIEQVVEKIIDLAKQK